MIQFSIANLLILRTDKEEGGGEIITINEGSLVKLVSYREYRQVFLC